MPQQIVDGDLCNSLLHKCLFRPGFRNSTHFLRKLKKKLHLADKNNGPENIRRPDFAGTARTRRSLNVGVLYDMRLSIEKKIRADGLDEMKVKGQIGLSTGRLLSLISSSTPDDLIVAGKLRKAAKDLLSINL